jgi:hypothetical protein
MHYGHKGSNESCQLNYSSRNCCSAGIGRQGRSAEESILSALLALELTGQL